MPAPWRFFQTNRRLRGQISVAFTVMGVHPALTCHISRSPQRLVLVPESHTGSAKISSESLLFSFSSIDSLSLGFGSFDTWDPSSRFFFCDLVIGHLHPTSLGGSSTCSFSAGFALSYLLEVPDPTTVDWHRDVTWQSRSQEASRKTQKGGHEGCRTSISGLRTKSRSIAYATVPVPRLCLSEVIGFLISTKKCCS